MMAAELRAAMEARTLICDGAMGTELQRAGLEAGRCGELWNVERPDAVLAIHGHYRTAGADLILTNTFGASRPRLARHQLEERVVKLNRAAAELARDAAGARGFAIGDIGPSGALLRPLGDADPEDLRRAFAEQARALLEGGLDAILVETMTAIEEMQLAVAAARDCGAELVFASFAFDHNKRGAPRTMMGVTPKAACTAMIEAGVDVVGANCGTDLDDGDWLTIVRDYRDATDLPILVEPNAGSPELTSTGARYAETPDEMGARVARLVEAGARLVGGCCGTTPDYVRAIADACKPSAGPP